MNKILSHPPDKLLSDHLINVADNSVYKIKDKSINLSLISHEELITMAYIVGISHDFGKFNPLWQNEIVKDNPNLPPHSEISALFGLCISDEVYKSNDIINFIVFLIIKSHHSNLSKKNIYDLSNYSENIYSNIKNSFYFEIINKLYDTIFLNNKLNISFDNIFNRLSDYLNSNIIKKLYKKIEKYLLLNIRNNKDNIELYLIINLLFSVLIDSDKKDAADIPQKLNTKYFEIKDKNIVDDYLTKLKKQDVNFNENENINTIRNKFYNEVVFNKKLNSQNKIYLLTAPTGIGKTFTAYSAALKLKEKIKLNSKIIYALPFTSIIDQTHDEIFKILHSTYEDNFIKNELEYLLKHHYLSDYSVYENSEFNYSDLQLLVESWDSLNIITTFIQLFHTIIGYKNRFLKKFHNIINSIIILDEIQNLPPGYNLLIKKIFKVLSEKFNTYFIIMTATQPNIFLENECVKLADFKSYFKENIFNRNKLIKVKGNYLIDTFFNYFLSNFDNNINSYLIILNTVNSVNTFYNLIRDKYSDYTIIVLTTKIFPNQRLDIIKSIKQKLNNKERIILICTQLIEAGVDLSFERVYRDFAPLSSIIQACGRCNRNNEFNSIKEVYIINLQKDNGKKYCDYIYPNKLLEITDNIVKKDYYESIDFFILSETYFSKFDFNIDSKQLLKGINHLNYDEEYRDERKAINQFKLIDESTPKANIVFCIDSKINELLNELKNINQIKNQWEKKGLISKIKKQINQYMISVYEYELTDALEKGIIDKFKDDFYYVSTDKIKHIYNDITGFHSEVIDYNDSIFF